MENINGFFVVVVVAAIAIIAAGIRWYRAEVSGDNYYSKYPGAKLLDDAAKQGKLVPGSMEAIIQRLGEAKDVAAEVSALRPEMGVK